MTVHDLPAVGRGSPAAERLVEIDAVSKTYRSRRGVVNAVEDFSLSIGQAEFIAIIGASGCGKTTVLKMIAGLQAPTEGRIERVRSVERRGGMSMVFQRPALLPWRTVIANVLAPMEIIGAEKGAAVDHARSLLARVGLNGFEDAYPHQLSGGMQQRVAICRALISSPDLLLMDEPFASLDAITREQQGLELQRVWMSDRKTVIFVTHNIDEATFLADRIVVMTPRPGRLAEIVINDLPRPRSLDTVASPEFAAIARQLRSMTVELATGSAA
ncbi:MAG TPA: ABC transporter ATP-binding protein [Candidatus Limnocylindrales bacterium]|nr:ABC transporter ATP-binding protein [Candidatus Limnocylindrales bacterium]